MAIKKTYKFCYVVNRVNRIWPTYATTLGTGQHREVRRRGKNDQSDLTLSAKVGQILLYFSKFRLLCTYPHIRGPNSVIFFEYRSKTSRSALETLDLWLITTSNWQCKLPHSSLSS